MEGTLKPNKLTIAINIDDPFFVFLERYENYVLYEEFLSYCWAMENLLFYQKICVIYQIILKYSNQCAASSNGEDVPRNKFEYLSAIYEHYEARIQQRQIQSIR
eukprot:376729_1